jgi:uncharacterized protein with HEPN domain
MWLEMLYLQDILDACNAIERFLQRTTETAFMQDELIQSAVMQKLIVVGEAATRLAPKLYRTTARNRLGRHCRFPQFRCP